MIYLLNKYNNRVIPKILSSDDSIYISDEIVPPYVIKYYLDRGIKILFNKGNNDIEVRNDVYEINDWLPESEYNELLSYYRVYLNDYNLYKSIYRLRSNMVVYIDKDSDEIRSYINNLRDNGLLKCKVKFTDTIPDDVIPIYKLVQDIDTDPLTQLNNVSKNYSIIHYIGTCKFDYYRRMKLSKYIISNVTDSYLKIIDDTVDDELDSSAPIYIISDPRKSNNILAMINRDNPVVIYDRTDNWSSLSPDIAELESKVIARADKIFTSAKYLIDSIPDEYKSKCELIPNGTTVRDYVRLDKYTRPTAIYAGVKVYKLNLELINKLAKVNPDWDIKIYVSEPEKVTSVINQPNVIVSNVISEDELFTELCKCNIGLIPFNDTGFTRGMLPLKLFNYINAHIPTLYYNCDECNEYSDVAFNITSSLDNLNLTKFMNNINISDDTFNDYIYKIDWNNKFKLMTDEILDEYIKRTAN